MFGIPNAPEFANPNTSGVGILHGVNYASAAAGILDETGRHYVCVHGLLCKFKIIQKHVFNRSNRFWIQGERYSLSQQVVNFESTLNELRRSMGSWNLSRYLSKSLAFLVFGSNDYINNYLLPELYTSRFRYTPNQFANLLLNRYSRQLLVSSFSPG